MDFSKYNENGWGLANYRGKVSFAFDHNGEHYTFTGLPISYGKLFLCYDHWEMPIKGTRGKYTLCGRYAALWNEETQEYDAPARLKFQEMCTDHLYIQASERDTIKGHGRLITEYIPAVSA